MIDLTNTTFIIPITIDSKDRLRNYNIIIEYLTKEFDTFAQIPTFMDPETPPNVKFQIPLKWTPKFGI